jgi:N-acetylglucosaminyldiphosphoundecaprenol N-acetyl-beta-D-mannosaminyltransferase
MLMQSQEHSALAKAMDRASLVVPDGVPIAWLQRKLGYTQAEVLRGYEALNMLCAEAITANQPIGLFGSTEAVLDALSARLRERHSGLLIGFVHAPPHFTNLHFKPDPSLVAEINSRNLRYLFVGLGCPKQEIWIDRYAGELNCTLLGVGAAFDWLAGTTRKPPGWMEKSGLAWLYRLFQNPRKLAHRYLIYNTKFLIAAMKLLVTRRFSSHR